MRERRTQSEGIGLAKKRFDILLHPDSWRQHALQTIVSRARGEVAVDAVIEGITPALDQPTAISRTTRGKVLWFQVQNPTKEQPASVTINGGMLLRHRTVTITEDNGHYDATVDNSHRVGVIPKIIFLRRLYHAFSGALEQVDAISDKNT